MSEFSGEDTRRWYLPRDLLAVNREQVIPEHSSLERSVARIVQAAGLPSRIDA